MKRGPRPPGGKHPAVDEIIDLVDGCLKPSLGRRLMAHVDDCPGCLAEWAAWKGVLSLLAAEAGDAPPPHLVAWASRLPVALARTPARKPGPLRIMADSWAGFWQSVSAGFQTPLPIAGVRSPDSPARVGRRRIFLSAESYDLDLEVSYTAQDDPRSVRGQILPAEGPRSFWRGTRVLLLSKSGVEARARLNRRGEFAWPRIRGGCYVVQVEGPARTTSPALEL